MSDNRKRPPLKKIDDFYGRETSAFLLYEAHRTHLFDVSDRILEGLSEALDKMIKKDQISEREVMEFGNARDAVLQAFKRCIQTFDDCLSKEILAATTQDRKLVRPSAEALIVRVSEILDALINANKLVPDTWKKMQSLKGRRGVPKSLATRKKSTDKWQLSADLLMKEIYLEKTYLSNDQIASEVASRWKNAIEDLPGHKSLWNRIAELRPVLPKTKRPPSDRGKKRN